MPRCSICNQLLPGRALHTCRKLPDKRRDCERCGYVFANSHERKRHLRRNGKICSLNSNILHYTKLVEQKQREDEGQVIFEFEIPSLPDCHTPTGFENALLPSPAWQNQDAADDGQPEVADESEEQELQEVEESMENLLSPSQKPEADQGKQDQDEAENLQLVLLL